jgi:hypothetical protein
MTPLRWLIVLFWGFVAIMLVKTFHDSDVARQNQAGPAPPAHYFYQAPSNQPAPNPKADVQQVRYVVQAETPPGNFTCQVTLKNVGGEVARDVQVEVRPFLGGHTGSDNMGHIPYAILSETDPLSQISNDLAFPDLEPGQESTESLVFMEHLNVEPGNNPKAQISFLSGKKSP